MTEPFGLTDAGREYLEACEREGSSFMSIRLRRVRCRFCGDAMAEGTGVDGPAVPGARTTRFCDEDCFALWSRRQEIPETKEGAEPSKAADYQGRGRVQQARMAEIVDEDEIELQRTLKAVFRDRP